MATSVTLFIILGAVSGSSHAAGVLPDSLVGAVGGTVMLPTTMTPPETPFLVVTWSVVDEHGASASIITSSNVNITAPEYTDRITLLRATGSLELRDLTRRDSGEYRVTIIPTAGGQQRGHCKLVIHEPVSNVVVTSSSTDLVEFSSSVSLSCSSSGSSLSFLWLNGSSEVTASERVLITDGGATLTIVRVTRYDQGPFRCHVSNDLGDLISDPVNLSVSFGPENINLTRSPSQEHYDKGSDIILVCSVASSPTAQFKWFLNGDLLPDAGPELRLMNVQMNQSGNYSCQAFNNKTLKHQTSQSAAISVMNSHVSNAVITPNATDMSELTGSVRLSCSSSGSFRSFLWLNSSSELTASERVQITDKGAALIIINVTRYDQGPFRCHVFNNFSNDTSEPVKLSINFGPENIHLTTSPSQEHYEQGSDIRLSCSAVSRPSALFQWILNGDLLTGTGPELRLIDLQRNQSGNYSCQAFNNKTLRYQTSQASVVSILTPVSNVVVTSNTTDVLELNSSVSLSCSSSGSSLSFLWLNGSSEVKASERVLITDGGATLTIVSLTRYDQGPFRCNVSNGVGIVISRPLILIIQYGPDSVTIVGPDSVHDGDFTMLHCSVVSAPSPTFTWLFNGNPTEVHGASYVIPTSSSSDTGRYTCTAVNAATELSQTVHHHLTVSDFSGSDCTATERTVYIIIGVSCFILVFTNVLTAYCVLRRRRVNSNYSAQEKEIRSVRDKRSDMYKITEKAQKELITSF